MLLGTISIVKRFQGPPTSGNGGYVCGRLAAFLDTDAAVVRLRVPPPLERELAVRPVDGGVDLVDGESVVAQARPAEVSLAPPEPVGFADAERAARGYRGFRSHWYPSCFVCGPERGEGDGLRIFPGPVAGRDLVACPWRPDASLASPAGPVAREFLWAALDCPGVFSFPEPPAADMLLGELQVALRGDVAVGERCVLVAWQLSHEGRKHRTASVLFGEPGDCRGVGIGVWIEVARREVEAT